MEGRFFKKLVAENYSELIRNMNPQIQEAQASFKKRDPYLYI